MRHCIVGHRSWIGAHLLLHHGHTHAVAPDLKLVDGCGTERIGSTEHHLVARLLELIGKLADGGGLANTIHAHHEHHVRPLGIGLHREAVELLALVLHQQRRNLLAQQFVQLARTYILVLGHAGLDALDDAQRGFYAYVARHKHLFQVVEHIVIDGTAPGHRTGNLLEQTLLGLLHALVEGLLIFFLKELVKKSHNYSICGRKDTALKRDFQIFSPKLTII